MTTVLATLLAAWGLIADAAQGCVWTAPVTDVRLDDVDGGFVRLVPAADGLLPDIDAVGAPALPHRTVLFAIPDRSEVTDVTADVAWETLAEGVRVEPVSEPVRESETPVPAVPDATIYNGTETWPKEAVRREEVGRMSGVRVLPVTVTPFRWNPVSGRIERAARLVVRVTFGEGAERSCVLSPGLLDSVQEAVVNPEAVSVATASGRTEETVAGDARRRPGLSLALRTGQGEALPETAGAGLFRTNPETNAFEYLLISPPDFYSDWCWYVGERRKTHASLRFAVKNTAEIYSEHPFPTDAIRNAAESIHAYLRQAVSNGVQYVVLGGAWLDAQNLNGYTPYFATGEAMSLSNCVPGIYGFPRENWRQIPSDLFYGCLDMKPGQKYPWDLDGDGQYIDQDDCKNNDTYPDVIVSRITLNPYTGIAGKVYNRHTLVTNYVAKLARGEAKDFPGHYCYGMSAASTGSSKLRKTGDRMYYRELEFYDGMLNMFDPRHHDTLEDDEYSTRVRYYDQYSNWRPLRQVKGMMNYTWTGGLPSLSAAMDDYYAADRDFGFVQAHGWAQGAAQFSAGRFATAKGLTLFNGGSGPCETGYPDYYVNSGNKKVLQYNVGDAAVTNPDGGALASVNNSRWSWAGGGGGFAAMSYYMLNEMLVGFNQERKDVGNAWLKGVRNYWPAGKGGGTAGWVLSEQILYGDPLVRLPVVPNAWWTGGESGVWDHVASNWTNNLDATTTFDVASNVYFNVGTNLSLDVADEIAALRLSLPVWEEGAVITLAGSGSLRVMQAVDVAGTNTTLRFDVEGGVGHNGIRFLTGAGDLVFAGTNRFYVGGIQNARRVSLLGGGVSLDFDEFPKEAFTLVIDGGRGATRPAVPNELRSKNVGGLTRFGSLAITNSHVKLSTVDAFGNGVPMTHSLVDSELEIAANVYYQRSGFPEGLNAMFLVDGDSAVTSSVGGLWTVKHTTTFVLGTARAESAPCRATCLTLGAETVNAGGKIVITNAPPSANSPLPATNTVEITRASALSGDVTVGSGVRLVLRELPLASVTSLTVEDGASVVLPDEVSGYWQIVPVSSKFACGSDVAFATVSNPSVRLKGSPSPTGSFFKEGALYRWTGEEGDWDLCFADTHPRMLFGDLAANDVTVRVAAAVSPKFVFFSNLRTRFSFVSASDDASALFSSVFFYGPTEFDVPVFATEYAAVATATSRFSRIVAPYVHVAEGAGLALAGSHWTDFRLDAGAVLVAVPGETLDWNAETSFAFPDDGEVLVDVGRLDLSDTPIPLVSGFGHVWTQADLKRFRLVQSDAELRIIDGALCVVRGDALAGPYSLVFDGVTNWNCAAWTATSGVAFPRPWGACALDWSADVVVTVSPDPQPSTSNPQPSTLLVDAAVHADRLTIHVPTNNVEFALRTSGVTEIAVATLDLSGMSGRIAVEVGTGTAEILTPTNETAECFLACGGTGTISLSGATLNLAQPGDFTMAAGSQGTLRFVASQGYERFRVAKVAPGFELGGLQLEATDREGRKIEGFSFAVEDGVLWCAPPPLSAEVPPGTNDFTHLVWSDVFGQVLTNVDWQATTGFELVGTPTSGVVIAKHGFATYWDRLKVTGDVTAYGDETLTPSVLPSGTGTLTLSGAFTVYANLKAYPQLLNASRLGIGPGSLMNVTHGNANLDVSGQNWRGIVGTGRLAFTDAKTSWIAVPSQVFAGTLTVETASDIVLTQQISPSNPFGVCNLSGAGSFRTDWGNGSNLRPVRTVQTAVSDFSGTLTAIAGSRDSKLVVGSDAPAPTTEKALILSGAAGASHALDIETNGCVILTGLWIGPINVQGLLVITNDCATNGLKVTLSGKGAVQVVAENEIPPVTPLTTDYVMPSYPVDPTPPDEPPVVDTRARVLTASVGAEGGTWSRLVWHGQNGDVVQNVDWSVITNVTLAATEGMARVIFDETDFTGVVCLAAGVCVEARKLTPFTLSAASEGTVDFRLSHVPTATADLLYISPSPRPSHPSQLSVTVHDRYGREIDVAGEVMFDAAAGKYYLNVQNVGRPNFSNTFDTQYDDTLSTSLGYSGSGNMTYKDRPGQFEKSRSGRALKGDNLAETIHSHNGVATVNMSGVDAWSINFVVKLPTNDKGIVFGWGNKDSGNGVALARVSANVAGVYAWKNAGAPELVASARVPFASTQFHSYAMTHDGQTLRLYADGTLAQEAALPGKYPTTGHYQYFKMYGQNGGLANGTSAVVDDFRLYLYSLTPASVRVIANEFRPWPETVSATVWKPGTRWEDLVWNTDVVDWDEIATARLECGAEDASVWCDAASFTNELVLAGGVAVQATNELPFVLASDPKGTVSFTLDDVTVSRRLARVAQDFSCDDGEFVLTVRGENGETPPDPWMVTRYVDGAYWLRIQNIAKPKYAFSFDGAFTTSLPGVTAPSLKDTNNAKWENSRSGKALTGRNPYFASGLGTPSAWTMHIVARLSAAANGITFAYGSTGKGLALCSPQTDVVAIGAWSGSARTELLRVAVPNAQVQFHAYSLVSTGSRLALWIDGIKAGETACGGYPGNGNAQFFSVYGGMPSGYAVGTDGAVDDWRFYEEVLAPSGIGMLAGAFRPWPEYRYTELKAETTWDAISWQGAEGDDKPFLLTNRGGGLLLTNACDLTNALVAGSLSLRVTGDGLLRSDAGMTFSSGLQIDASGLDGTNLAKYAVAGAPYVRWLIRGAYTGRPTVTALPAMPNHYAVHAEDFANCGVRLVVTAPRGTRLGSVSVSIGNDDFSGLTGELGLYPERANAWLPYRTWSTAFQEFGAVDVAAIPMTSGQIDSASPYDAPAALFFRHTSFDGNSNDYDGKECGYVLSNLTAFAEQYRVIVYLASNQGSCWGPVTIGERNYTGLLKGSDVQWATISDSTLPAWGMRSATPREGVNAVISDVLTNDVVSLVGHRLYAAQTARGQIAAFQIVKVGEIPEVVSVDYTATVTADTTWADGEGEGLVPSVKWVNDPGSTITLTTGVANAALTFDTPVTAAVVSVVSAFGRNLVLTPPQTAFGHEVESLDFELADGRVTVRDTLGARYLFAGADTVAETRGRLLLNVESGRSLTLAQDIAWELDDTAGSGGHVRFLGDRGTLNAPPVQTSGAIVSYEKATVKRATNNEFSVLRTLTGDEVVYDANGKTILNPLEVRGGSLTLRNGGNKSVLYYGSVKDVMSRHSSIEVSGGRLTVDVNGTGTKNTDCGFLVGTTDSTKSQPNIAVSGGEMDLGTGRLTMWERSDLTVSGGMLSAQGLWKGGGGATKVTLSGDGVIALGAGGIGKSGGGSMSVTLAGGTLRATATMTNSLATSVTGTVRLEAVSGQALTFAEMPMGTATLLCGGGSADGAVVFAKGVNKSVTLGGTFTLYLTAEQAASQQEVVLFGTADSFDRTNVTVRGPNGSALPDGEVRYADGQAIWMPAAASVEVSVDGVTVRVPRKWLEDRKVDATALQDDHALTGANGLPVAVSYVLGLEPTNAVEDVRCSIEIDKDGGLTLDLPHVDPARQPNAAAILYVLQHKADLGAVWKDHSTNGLKTVTVEPDGSPARFFRYLILLR